MNITDALPLVVGPTPAFYADRAQQLLVACRSIDNQTILHVQKFHPDPDKLANINKPDTDFSIEDARLILAREHGFEDWPQFDRHIHALNNPESVTTLFERAADAVIFGDRQTLANLLEAHPGLVKCRSERAHHATLLHYLAANGVESFRQVVPANAYEIGYLLLQAGAETDALSQVYKDEPGTTLELLVSSIHAIKAGVQAQLTGLLLNYGAAIEGVRNDGSPLLLALASGFPPAAEMLAARGARVNNVVTAAGLGFVDRVLSCFDENGKLNAHMPRVAAGWLTIADTVEANAALGLVWAALNNRLGVVELLIQKGVSVASKDQRGWTALHWAAYCGHIEVVRLLISHKAPLEAHNEFGGTVLDQTLWATSHNGLKDEHIDVIRMLLKARARIHVWWLLSDLNPPLDERVASILRECNV